MKKIPGKVLLVDSEMLIHLAVSQVYRNAGPYFISAVSASEALQKIELFAFDLVLLALDGNTEQSLRLLKSIDRRFPGTPVILMAETSQRFTELTSLVGGGKLKDNWHYLEKPFNLDILTALIDRHLIESQNREQQGRDNRNHLRNSYVETIQLLLNSPDGLDVKSIEATLTDVSDSGFGLITKHPLEKSQPVGLTHTATKTSGVVAWSSMMDSHIFRAGIRFC